MVLPGDSKLSAFKGTVYRFLAIFWMLFRMKHCPAEIPEAYLSLGLSLMFWKPGVYQSILHSICGHDCVLNAGS